MTQETGLVHIRLFYFTNFYFYIYLFVFIFTTRKNILGNLDTQLNSLCISCFVFSTANPKCQFEWWLSFFFSVETVPHRPILTRPPRNSTVLIGSNVSMNCQVLSDAHRHLEWYHGYHTSLDTVNNQSLRVEVKVGAACMQTRFLLIFAFFHFESLQI